MQDLIITTEKIKKELLLKRSIEGIITNEKIMTLSEIKKLVQGEISSIAKIKLSREFNISLNKSEVYIKNILFGSPKLKEYYEYLKKEGLIFQNSKTNFKNIKVINVILDDYILNYFENSNIKYIKLDEVYNHKIYNFINNEDEILWVINKIKELNMDFSKVKLVEVKNEYKPLIKRLFKIHNLPINIDEEVGVNKTKTFIDFFDRLCESKDICFSLKSTPKGEIYNKIVSYFNSNDFEVIDDLTLKMICEDFKKISKVSKKTKNSIECISLDDVYINEYYYFFMGFNDSYPRVYKDEDFYSDEEKKSLGLLTSFEKNNLSKANFLNLFKGIKNLYLSYATESTFLKYNKSMFIKDYDIEESDVFDKNLYSSNEYNKIYFAKLLDEFIKFGEINKDLSLLNNSYDIDYLIYSNKFSGLNSDKIVTPITLSYSSVKTYYECAFKYYIEKILKINSMENSLAIHIGNVYHYVLSKIYDEDFSFDSMYDSETRKLQINAKEKFFLKNLKGELKKIIEFLLEFNDHTSLNQNLSENEFLIENIVEGKVNFKGFIDNIKYSDIYKLMVVLDYKTGSVEASLDNINHGFNLQLPSYLYLVNEKMPEYKVIGTYLDKILDAPSINEDENDIRNKLKFVGYSTSNESDLEKLDSGYANSRYIKSLKLTSNGFYVYSKVLDEKNINSVKNIAEDKIKEAAKSILNAQFDINPKQIDKVVEKCKYCKYKDICFMTNEDVNILENTKIKDIL